MSGRAPSQHAIIAHVDHGKTRGRQAARPVRHVSRNQIGRRGVMDSTIGSASAGHHDLAKNCAVQYEGDPYQHHRYAGHPIRGAVERVCRWSMACCCWSMRWKPMPQTRFVTRKACVGPEADRRGQQDRSPGARPDFVVNATFDCSTSWRQREQLDFPVLYASALKPATVDRLEELPLFAPVGATAACPRSADRREGGSMRPLFERSCATFRCETRIRRTLQLQICAPILSTVGKIGSAGAPRPHTRRQDVIAIDGPKARRCAACQPGADVQGA